MLDLQELEELRLDAYENYRIYEVDIIFNSSIKFMPEKLKSKWSLCYCYYISFWYSAQKQCRHDFFFQN